MKNTVYSIAERGRKADIIDFINYVFSNAHCPHDFKILLPKVYADNGEENIEDYHYIAEQDGKIVACVANRPTTLVIGGRTLKCGYVGSVSVHPYHRGEGHMKKLMSMVLADAKKAGLDMIILGGQRQRYAYFGFEKIGTRLDFELNPSNVRHAMADVREEGVVIRDMRPEEAEFARGLWEKRYYSSKRDNMFMELTTWGNVPKVIEIDGRMAGYRSGSEIALENEADFLRVAKSIAVREGKTVYFLVSPADTQRIAALGAIAEDVKLVSQEMANVLNWKNVLEICLESKNRICPLGDAEAVLDIEGDGVFRVCVKDGHASVSPAEKTENAVRLTHNGAQRLFFSLDGGFTGVPEGFPRGWTQLPFYISEMDCF